MRQLQNMTDTQQCSLMCLMNPQNIFIVNIELRVEPTDPKWKKTKITSLSAKLSKIIHILALTFEHIKSYFQPTCITFIQ